MLKKVAVFGSRNRENGLKKFLAPEIVEMVQFLAPETAKILQFLDPEIVKMDGKIEVGLAPLSAEKNIQKSKTG